MDTDTGQLLFRPEESAEMLRVSRSRLFELLASGELRSVQIGRSRRIPREALESYVRQLVGSGGPSAA